MLNFVALVSNKDEETIVKSMILTQRMMLRLMSKRNIVRYMITG